MKSKLIIIYAFILFTLSIYADDKFKVVVLGCSGGPKANNLSSYLLAPINADHFIALDAGTLLDGIVIANEKNSFNDIPINKKSKLSFEYEILQNHIKAYLISHAHLDHVAGLILNSPTDSKKPILGINSTINFIRDYLFNWKIWPNFGSEGVKPVLNQYQYNKLKPEQKVSIPKTKMSVESFLLSHPNGYFSTAFLIEHSDHFVVYFGDTAPDELENSKHIQRVWKKIAPLILQNKLHGIFLECSYSNQQPSSELFGHLDPKYMMQELNNLALLVDPANPKTALKNLKVFVTHIKESPLNGPTSKEIIQRELKKLNNLQIQFIFPKQGERFEF